MFGKSKVGGRRLLGLAVEASSNGIVLTDATRDDNPIIYVNPAFERITGYPAEEVLGRNCRFWRDLREEQPGLDGLRAAVEAGGEWTGVLRNYKKDGTPFWTELHLSPVRDGEGTITNYIGVQNDVTDRRHAQEERLKVSAEYEKIIRILPNVVFRSEMGEDGEIYHSYVEGALAEQFGVTTERIAGKKIEEIFPTEFLETVRPAYERAFAGETVEFLSRIGDRSFANVAMPFAAAWDERGPAEKIVGYATEVTARVKEERPARGRKNLRQMLCGDAAQVGGPRPGRLPRSILLRGWMNRGGMDRWGDAPGSSPSWLAAPAGVRPAGPRAILGADFDG